MKKQNFERVNLILNEVGQYIVGTLGQYSLDWDYACFLNTKSVQNPYGEFYLFHANSNVGFKSVALNKILFELFEHYQDAMSTESENTRIRYVIRNSDLKSSVKVEKMREPNSNSEENSANPANLLRSLISSDFEA